MLLNAALNRAEQPPHAIVSMQEPTPAGMPLLLTSCKNPTRVYALSQGAPRRFCAPTLDVSRCQKMPPQNRPTTALTRQCMVSSAGLRRISVSVRLNSTATSRANGVRGGRRMGGRGVTGAARGLGLPLGR